MENQVLLCSLHYAVKPKGPDALPTSKSIKRKKLMGLSDLELEPKAEGRKGRGEKKSKGRMREERKGDGHLRTGLPEVHQR